MRIRCRFSDRLLPNLYKRAVRRLHQVVYWLHGDHDLRSVHRFKNMLHGRQLPRRGLHLLTGSLSGQVAAYKDGRESLPGQRTYVGNYVPP